MSKILARLITQSVKPNVLDALTQKLRYEQKDSAELIQSHYTVEGSLDELCGAVNLAFRKWCDVQCENDNYQWGWYSCNTLSIMDDAIIFYCYSRGEYCYYQLPYSVDTASNTVTISGDPEKIEVALVIKTLGLSEGEPAEEEAEAVTVAIQTATKEQKPVMETGNENAKAQDTVGTGHMDITSAPVSHSDANPKVNTSTATDADESGASVPDPNDAAKAKTPVQHSGDEGVGDAGEPNKVGGPVAAELADTGAGFKGENPATPGKNVSVTQRSKKHVGKSEYLLQSVGVDQSNNSFCTILSQSVEEVNGKKLLHIQGIATRADIISANGFVYPLGVWEDNLDDMNKQATAGKFIGKLEHPDQEQGLKDTAIRFEKFWIQGSDVHFDAVVLDTEDGKELQALIGGGVQIDLSSRGYGTAQKQSWRGQEVMVIQSDFVCTAFDAVHHGASTGSSITSAQYQAATPDKGENMDPVAQATETDKTLTPRQQAEAKVAKIREESALKQARSDFLAAAGLTDLGTQALAQALDKCEDIVSLVQTHDSLLPVFQASFAADKGTTPGSSTWAPTFMVKQSVEELAPKTVGEMIDRLVADLPDEKFGTETQGKVPHNHFSSPRAACRRILQNIASEVKVGFNGPAAAMSLLALEQGKVDRAQNILEQSLATGSTTAAGHADGGGAPLSAPLIFPLVRRVYPRYIMNEIASVQPMDRPDGKIFYLDTYRTEDPAGIEKRMDLNTSSNPFSSSYADNSTEGSAAPLVRLRLTSVAVSANTKKLGAAWSLEEMQDLRAYHGLDAAQELMSGVAREMALEWNLKVLNDMLAQASAASLTFGGVAPASGFPNQVDWDAYLWNYIQKLDNAIFAKRNGPMTHLVCGVDAALALAKSGRMTYGIGGDNGGDMEEQYPGAVYFGVVTTPTGSRYKVMKTNFWGTGTTNGAKILGLRRGGEWSDTPYIWAPYTDYVTPVFTDPADFSQKQGIISRAGNQVVVPDAMGIITVSPSGQGVVI